MTAKKMLKHSAAIAGSCLALLTFAGTLPARAQYSPYSYLYLGQSLLYPLTRTLSMPYMYGPYNSNPLFSTSSYMRGISSRAIQWPYIYPYVNNTYGQYGYRTGSVFNNFGGNNNQNNQNNPPSAADEPDNANPGGNTMNSPNPYQTQEQNRTDASANLPPPVVPSSGAAPSAVNSSPYGSYGSSGPSGFSGSPATAGNPASTTASAGAINSQSVAPPVAPKSKHRKHEKTTAQNADSLAGSSKLPSSSVSNSGSAGSASTGVVSGVASGTTSGAVSTGASGLAAGGAAGGAGMGRPLAEGFINHLNSNYQGDLGRALGNSDTRSWAKAMGVIEPDVLDGSHLSGDRIEVINRMLKDNTLDPVSKLETMRILLKKGPAAP